MMEIRELQEFDRLLKAPEPTVVLFWATWCPFCRRFKPEFDRLSREIPCRSAAVYLDDESNPLWDDYAVDVVPTLMLLRGGEVLDRENGILGYGLDREAVSGFANRVRARLS